MRTYRLGLAVLAAVVALGVCGCVGSNFRGGPGGGGAPAIEVNSTPSGARIAIDGADSGRTTPVTITGLEASPGGTSHTVRLDLDGYYSYSTVVQLATDGGTQSVSADLVPLSSAPASLYVQTIPSGAEVVLDGLLTGRHTPVQLTNLGPNVHTVEVQLSGYTSRVESINLFGERDGVMELQLTGIGRSAISGSVYDKVAGGLVVGARVAVDQTSDEAVTTQQGSYAFEDLPQGYYDLTATKTLNDGTQLIGRRENVYVSPDNGRMMTADIVMASQNEMAEVDGTVRDRSGRAVANAYVYVDMGNAVYFAPVSEQDGTYRFVDIPQTPSGKSYYVVASAPGFANAATTLNVSAGQVYHVDLTMNTYGASSPEAPLKDWAQALTYPSADTSASMALLAVRGLLAERGSGTERPAKQAILRRLADKTRAGVRAFPPAGYVVENDVAWISNSESDLAGYDVRRSESSDAGYKVISTIWDPNATFLADTSPTIGPGHTFYYDLLAFTLNGDRSSASDSLTAAPLDRLDLVSPHPGAVAPSPVRFEWSGVNGAGVYEAIVFGQQPDYDTSNQGNIVWDNKQINAGWTSVGFGDGGTLNGSLLSGDSYYAVVIAGDGDTIDNSNALSFSPIVQFVAP